MIIYGLVLVILFIILCLLSTTLVYYFRDHYLIQFRNPTLIIVNNIGITVSFSLLSFRILIIISYFFSTFLILQDIIFKPAIPCVVVVISFISIFSLVGFPLLLRIWESCIRYYLSDLKVQYRSTLQDNNWILRNDWMVNRKKFIYKFLAMGLIAFNIPLFYAVTIHKHFEYFPGITICDFPKGLSIVLCLCGGLFLLAFIRLVMLIFLLLDAYKLKLEFIIYIISWSFIIVSIPLYSHLSLSFLSSSLSPAIITLLGLVATLLSSCIPLYFVFLERVAGKCVVDAKKYEDFINLLQSRHFRSLFYDFLTRKHCEESLQFYEAIYFWKSQNITDSSKSITAKKIVNLFVIEDGERQVHIAGPIRDIIVNKIDNKIEGETPGNTEDNITIFDEALEEIMRELYINLFVEFKLTKNYAEACQGITNCI